MTRRVAVATVLVVVAALVVGGALWWRSQPGTDLERAMALAPADAERVTWTDWSGIRAELGSDVDADAAATRVADFLDEGYEADLTSTSALLSSAETLQELYGFSPASLEWELLSQSAAGAVLVMALPEAVDTDELGDRFEDLGYGRPDDDSGVWTGGPQLLPRIAPSLTPELQFLAINADERLVLASDAEAYLAEVADGLGDDEVSEGLAAVVEPSGGALSAVVYDSAYVCTELAMSAADAPDRAQAESLVADAGDVSLIRGYAMSEQPGGGIRVVMAFENDDQARENADARRALASGPAPGQGGDFSDRFTVERVSAEGSIVTMDLEPVEGQYVLSDLSSGPVLFATC